MRTKVILSVAILLVTLAAPVAAVEAEANPDDAEETLADTLESLPVAVEVPWETPDADDAGSGASDSAPRSMAMVAVVKVSELSGLAGEGILALGLGLVAGAFGVMRAGGDAAVAAIQTVAASPLQSAAMAAAMLIALGAWAGLWSLAHRYGSWAAIPLFSRIAKSQMLQNQVRADVFEAIKQQPGINVSELARSLDIAWGTATHHLQKLRSERMIAVRRISNQKCYFPNGGTYTPGEMDLMSATKSETARRIASLLIRQGPTCHKDISAALGVSPALVSFHMRKLLEAGVVQRSREGRRAIFSALADTLSPTPRPAHH